VPFGVSTRDGATFLAVLARHGLRAAHLISGRSAGYEPGVGALSVLVEYELTPHGHRRLAWLSHSIDVGFVGSKVANNYHCETTPSVLPGVTYVQDGKRNSAPIGLF
jgi:hypothetical protein